MRLVSNGPSLDSQERKSQWVCSSYGKLFSASSLFPVQTNQVGLTRILIPSRLLTYQPCKLDTTVKATSTPASEDSDPIRRCANSKGKHPAIRRQSTYIIVSCTNIKALGLRDHSSRWGGEKGDQSHRREGSHREEVLRSQRLADYEYLSFTKILLISVTWERRIQRVPSCIGHLGGRSFTHLMTPTPSA